MRAVALAALLLLAACGGAEPREGELSSDEERQLDEAAEMLDEPAREEVDGVNDDGSDAAQTEEGVEE